MKRRPDVIARSSVFLWIAVATGAGLLIPWLASRITDEVAWSATDFVLMGILLFCSGSLFVLVARKTLRVNRVVLGTVFAAAVLYIWAELAVGVFTHLGS